ncbi:tetratricopeptide repeat protein [Pseudooctadecabacter sp.]|uniref:tetratricopeptide repeat protein n=1 Tax=Pseudooctadecabacter sp. TaxID=1966338 RepID=UPI0025CC4353|nr:tetratricopeptide repeat protein [Pseudooctadecabacter sp.]
MRYSPSMGMNANIINSIATALCVTVGISGPLGAQTDRLDQLFEQLLEAEPQQVARIEGQIITEFGKSGSASMDLLRKRGEDALEAAEFDVAVEHFTALIDHAPEFAEGYHGRATAFYNLGLIGPAIDDLRQTLVLQPRHLGAMTGVAVVLEELGRPEDALDIWRQLADFSPADADIAEVIDRLTTQLAGETL